MLFKLPAPACTKSANQEFSTNPSHLLEIAVVPTKLAGKIYLGPLHPCPHLNMCNKIGKMLSLNSSEDGCTDLNVASGACTLFLTLLQCY